MERLGKRRQAPGRLLLLSNQRVEETWAEHQHRHRLRSLGLEDAEALLRDLLEAEGRPDELRDDQVEQAVERLHGNPRALGVLVAALKRVPYEDLMIAEDLDGRLGAYLAGASPPCV